MMQRPGSLKFINYIKSLSSPWVFEHFLLETDSSRKILSTNIIEKAIAEFLLPENLLARFRSLSQKHRILCSMTYLTGDAGITCDTDDPLEHSLVRSFLVFAANDQNGNTKLFGFEEFEGILRTEMLATIIEFGKAETDESAAVSSQWKWRSLNDLTVLISLAAQGELRKTRNNRLARTSIQKLKRLTENAASGGTETGECVARIMIAYCVSKGILREDELEYHFNQMMYERWALIPLEDRLNDCKDFVIHHTGSWRIAMLHELLHTTGVSSIELKFVPDADQGSVYDSIRALRFAGVIEHRTVDNRIQIMAVHQFDTSGESETTALVQADFSAVIAQESDPAMLYTFTQIGELLSLDKVYKGKIDKKILCNALSRGIDGDSLLDWLNKRQAPPNVLETVREWIREFFRLYISDRSILVSGDEKVSRQIESYDPLLGHLEIIKAHAVYQIKRGHEAQVKEILSNIGFDYRKPGESRIDFNEEPATVNESVNYPVYWKPVTEIRAEEKKQSVAMRGTKYGEELKALDMSEVVHVIDYAVLTGRNLTFDYEGSPYLKPGVYTVLPLSCRKGMEPVLEAEMLKTKTRKQFYIKKIRKIGVAAE